ncbi:hypothetical protein MTO96_021361 [Rhipicephalus appendiculatus]
MGALAYHENITKAVSWPRSALRARLSVGPTVIEGNQSRHAGTRDGPSNSMNAAHTHVTSQNLKNRCGPRVLRVALLNFQEPISSSENREWQRFWEHEEATIRTHTVMETCSAGATKRVTEEIRLTEANIAVKVLTE